MKIVVHEDYDPITVQNDIAVLQLDGTIEMNENIAGVCPANATIDYERQQALVSGWGALNFARDPGKCNIFLTNLKWFSDLEVLDLRTAFGEKCIYIYET